jgi:TolA-binding protein
MFKAVGLFLLVLTAAQVAFADAAADLREAEGLYKAGQYAKTEQIYQDVLNKADPNKPDELELAFNARRKLPCVYLAMDRQPQAQLAVQQLLAKHPGHERLPHSIHETIEQAKQLDKTLQARQVYQKILAAQPKHPQAVWLKMAIAVADVHLNNDQGVDSTLQSIIAQHADDERAVEAFGQIAWAYRKLNQNAKARNVYQYVVDNWPNKDRAVFSQRGIILCNIELGDQAAANAGVQKLLAKYAGSKYMAEIVRNIAVEYYRKGNLDEASTLHQYVVDKHPNSLEALWSGRDIALCGIDAGNDQAVQAALQKLVTGFAGHARLPEALADVGEYYRKKGNLQNARQVHQRVVTQFPASPEAIQSQRNAILCSIGLNDEPQIEAGIQTLLTQFATDKDIAAIASYIADRLGQARDDEKLKLYQYIVDQHPEHEIVVPAKARLGQIMMRRGDEKGAEAVFQKILVDKKVDPMLPKALALMADAYWERASAYERAGLEPIRITLG